MSSIGPYSFSSSHPPTAKTGTANGAASVNNDEGSGGATPTATDSGGGGKAWTPPISTLFTADLRLNAMQVSRLLRQLLQLPAEMVALLALLAQLDAAVKPDLLKKLLNANTDISLEELQALLLQRLSRSEEKLLKLMQASPMGAGAMQDGTTSSLLELLRIRGELASRTESSPAEALRTLILLYLPSYPTQDAQRVSLLFLPTGQKHPVDEEDGTEGEGFPSGGGGSGEENGTGQDLRWLIVIQTVSLGLFHIILSMSRSEAGHVGGTAKNDPRLLRLSIGYEPPAAVSLEEIRTGLEQMAQAENLPTPEITLKPRPLRENPSSAQTASGNIGQPVESKTPSVSIQPVDSVPAIGIHWAYRVVRLILDIDNTNRLTGV